MVCITSTLLSKPSMPLVPITFTDGTAHQIQRTYVLSAVLEVHIATTWTKSIFSTLCASLCGAAGILVVKGVSLGMVQWITRTLCEAILAYDAFHDVRKGDIKLFWLSHL